MIWSNGPFYRKIILYLFFFAVKQKNSPKNKKTKENISPISSEIMLLTLQIMEAEQREYYGAYSPKDQKDGSYRGCGLLPKPTTLCVISALSRSSKKENIYYV